MRYLAEGPNRAAPRELWPHVRAVVVAALPYGAPNTVAVRTGPTGTIAGYARGADYHAVLKRKLRQLADAVAELAGCTVTARACVDTAPLLERELAERAGLGFFGKNCMLIAPGLGSFIVLGELLLDVELAAVTAAPASNCGSCSACLDACPTRAFTRDYVLDARRCISYLTIEHRGDIPLELRPGIGTRVFGCDVCQTVCPFNVTPRAKGAAPELVAARAHASLSELLFLTSGEYRRWVKGSARRRASREQLARNAAVALGNCRDPAALEPLLRALHHHRHERVRGHAAWAVAELALTTADVGRELARAHLQRACIGDTSASVRAEATAALARLVPLGKLDTQPGRPGELS
jgi:epoxyqueuosine reductase